MEGAAYTPEGTHMIRFFVRAARKMNLIPPAVPTVESMTDPEVERIVQASNREVRQVAQLRSEVFGRLFMGDALTQPDRPRQMPRRYKKGGTGAIRRL